MANSVTVLLISTLDRGQINTSARSGGGAEEHGVRLLSSPGFARPPPGLGHIGEQNTAQVAVKRHKAYACLLNVLPLDLMGSQTRARVVRDTLEVTSLLRGKTSWLC